MYNIIVDYSCIRYIKIVNSASSQKSVEVKQIREIWEEKGINEKNRTGPYRRNVAMVVKCCKVVCKAIYWKENHAVDFFR